MKKWIVVVVVLGIVILGIWVGMMPKTNTTSNNNSGTPASSCPNVAANTMSYCDNKLNSLTVKAGTSVTFRNDSDEDVQIDSNPHPVHTDNAELNVGLLTPGQSKTVKLTTKGTWGIHNHLDPTETAKVIVE